MNWWHSRSFNRLLRSSLPGRGAQAREVVEDGLRGDIINAGWGGLGGVAHEVGKLRMERTKGKYVEEHGSQPGVLDENLRFLGHQRLFACDLSVFSHLARR